VEFVFEKREINRRYKIAAQGGRDLPNLFREFKHIRRFIF